MVVVFAVLTVRHGWYCSAEKLCSHCVCGGSTRLKWPAIPPTVATLAFFRSLWPLGQSACFWLGVVRTSSMHCPCTRRCTHRKTTVSSPPTQNVILSLKKVTKFNDVSTIDIMNLVSQACNMTLSHFQMITVSLTKLCKITYMMCGN